MNRTVQIIIALAVAVVLAALTIKNHLDQQVLVADYTAVHQKVVGDVVKEIEEKHTAMELPTGRIEALEAKVKELEQKLAAEQKITAQLDLDKDGVLLPIDTCPATDKGEEVGDADQVHAGCSLTDLADLTVFAGKVDKTKDAGVEYKASAEDQLFANGTTDEIECTLTNSDTHELATITKCGEVYHGG